MDDRDKAEIGELMFDPTVGVQGIIPFAPYGQRGCCLDLRIASRDARTELQLLKDRVAEMEDRLAGLEAERHE